MLGAFSSCFARRALNFKNPACMPLRGVIRTIGRSLQKGHGLVALAHQRSLWGL